MRLCTSPKLAGLDSRLRSRNSETGLRFEKRDISDCDRMVLKRSPRLRREVNASSGMLILAIASARWHGGTVARWSGGTENRWVVKEGDFSRSRKRDRHQRQVKRNQSLSCHFLEKW